MEEANKIVEKTRADEYLDPVTKKFKKDNPGGGRPIGTKNFSTDFDEVVEEIAKINKITISEARKMLLKKAYVEAKGGNFNFYKDTMDRYYGKAKETLKIEGEITQLTLEERKRLDQLLNEDNISRS